MPASDIVIKGAREHNLQNVSLILPRNQLTCLTGVSGSGKSSLAFDTLFAEGQRRYVESLSSFARQFLGQMPKPDVDFIGGLSPSISISQKSSGRNPRSTVGTITEIYDYLRVLYARVGQGFCPRCDEPITSQSREQMIARILQLPEGARFQVLAPLIRGQKGEYRDLFDDLLRQGFVRARVDGEVVSLADDQQLDRQMRHNIEVVIDRLVVRADVRARLAEAVDLALRHGKGSLIIAVDEDAAAPRVKGRASKGKTRSSQAMQAQADDIMMSIDYACASCGLSFEPPSPQLFSFNSPQGMCLECDGLGEIYSFDPELMIPDDTLPFRDGCIELLGKWREMGRGRRHVYQGVADTMERVWELPEGTLLETPWRDLEPRHRDLWLWGAGDQHITFTWRGGSSPIKYGGVFDGVIPELLGKYRNSKSRPQLRKLEQYMNTIVCPDCEGERLNPHARAVRLRSEADQFQDRPWRSLPDVCQLAISDAATFFETLELDDIRTQIAAEAIKEIRARLGFLLNVGLDYLSLGRTAPTLSGGESQRIRLAGQIGSGLVGVLYILDEPSIGLHPRDNDRLLATLQQLRDLGNTVVVVEHDEDTIRAADHVIDFGPGPGVRGGEIVAEGAPAEVAGSPRSVTGKYLSGARRIETPTTRREGSGEKLVVRGATHNNLRDVDVEIPLGKLICVTGVSGSGKSSLVNDILVETLRRDLNFGSGEPGEHRAIEGIEHLDKMIAIDQSPIGRTPRSNPGTYIKVFDDIRALFTQLPEAKKRGYQPGRFSFNVTDGRCEACEGNGSNKLEMDFLADIWVQCPICEGKRFNRETLQVRFKDHSIADVLELDIQQAIGLFENQPKILHKLQTLHDVGLDYLKLGQPSPTLSGGEAQRIKLARELVKKSTGQTLYLLDEPTTGLHFADIDLLLKVLQAFVDAGNTVLVVEHNLDVIKTADWIIDLGPEGGAGGGELVAQGTPEEVARTDTHTGRALAPVLAGRSAEAAKAKKKPRRAELSKKIVVEGASQHNLRGVHAEIPRDKMTVFCGPSGSGKSSLAMDTIYAEGQRRYVESLSAYARQFVGQMQKPQVERVEGLSPAIAIEQKNLGSTPRSTVGTVTEIYDYLRILFSRLGTPYCPACELPIGTQTSDEVIDKVMSLPEETRVYLMAPMEVEAGQDYETLWEELRGNGYQRVRVDGATHSLEQPPTIDRRRRHVVEVVVDRAIVKSGQRSRLADSIEAALSLGRGVLHVAMVNLDLPEEKWETVVHSQHLACDACGRSFEPLAPHHFSFNSQLGWCPGCEGLGTQTGANPAALIRDPQRTLADGAINLWPDLQLPVARRMLEALGTATGIPLDVPYDQLSSRHVRQLLHGTGDEWIEVPSESGPPLFRFQYKGLYPALGEASRLSPNFRTRLEHLVDEVACSACGGSRLRDDAAAVRFAGATIDHWCARPLGKLQDDVKTWKLSDRDRQVAGELLREIKSRLQFLNDVGLDYLSLDRTSSSLSNGEAQRIRLASQLGSGLCGVLYVLDEPTIGLHPRDNHRLLKALHKLRDLGNTLLIVEHDREVIEGSDRICDFGPKAGRLGGQIVARGTPKQVERAPESVTGPYLSGKKALPVPSNRRVTRPQPPEPARKKKPAKSAKKQVAAKTTKPLPEALVNGVPADWLEVIGARHNNLRDVSIKIPLAALTAVTGPSGSGKSTLIGEILYHALARRLHRARLVPGPHEEIRGIEHINKVIRVDQQPLGNSPSSNPATYTGVFDLIRELYSQMPESKLRGYGARRFSFNVAGGRCEECEGNGQICIEMHFLPDVWVPCTECEGKRYNRETLSVKFRGQSISDVLEMTCGEALQLFHNIPRVRRIIRTLCDVGLDYLTLGQPAPTLSGGEAQRVKLAAELARPDTGRTLYLLDEPTTGLHFDDIAKLMDVLQRLVDLGNTVVVIEHNLDLIKSADWLIDMGPEAGEAGGRLVASGTPEEVASYAEQALAAAMSGAKPAPKKKASKRATKKVAKQPDIAASVPQAGGAELLRSHTGEALAPVLAAGPYVERQPFDVAVLDDQEGDIDIADVGREAKMPWELDGRRWHTIDRVDRKGEPVQWDGRILEHVVDQIHELAEFGDTDWNGRSVVEIAAPIKSHGWFFHAITAETWLVRMKFRVPRGTFKQVDLAQTLSLGTWNDVDAVPKYSNDPRCKVRTSGAVQEVQIDAYRFEEIDTPAFQAFLRTAVEAGRGHQQKVASDPSAAMPWKVMGEKWHLMRKGFPPNKSVAWPEQLLTDVLDLLRDLASEAEWTWTNKVLVHQQLPGDERPWATIVTKRVDGVAVHITGPKGSLSQGRVAALGESAEVDATDPEVDVAKLLFVDCEQFADPDVRAFLSEHLEATKSR
ncbi:MAG: excinuclease ABC subunit UvrA [Planctomycetales bacterium]|nr:excinuclease ABC subunit UvrA [Planctomycetales bacterium]